VLENGLQGCPSGKGLHTEITPDREEPAVGMADGERERHTYEKPLKKTWT